MGEELHAVKCSTMRCGAGPLACAGTPGRLAAPRVTIHVSYREGLSHEFPGVFHPNLANVAIQCSPGFAYESYMGGNCGGPGNAQQNFNAALDMGWTIAPVPSGDGAGLTNPGTIFEPPSARPSFCKGSTSAFGQTDYRLCAWRAVYAEVLPRFAAQHRL